MSIKTSLRFKIFERDNFTCQYCGRRPPAVVLHCDHIHPKSKGGLDDEINLITSCQDCNLGKRDKIIINKRRTDVKVELEKLEETEKQIKEYYKYLKKIANRKEHNPEVELIMNKWSICSGFTYNISETGKKNIAKLLKSNLPEDIMEATEISWANDRIKADEKWVYMCGVLKNLKLKREDPEKAKEKEENIKLIYSLKAYWKSIYKYPATFENNRVEEWLNIFGEMAIKEKIQKCRGSYVRLTNLMDEYYERLFDFNS